jgi:hypothetical protein
MRRREFIAGLGGTVVWPLANEHKYDGDRLRLPRECSGDSVPAVYFERTASIRRSAARGLPAARAPRSATRPRRQAAE